MVFGAIMPEDETVERIFEADGSADLRDLIFSLLNSLDFDFDHLYEFQVRKEKYGGSLLDKIKVTIQNPIRKAVLRTSFAHVVTSPYTYNPAFMQACAVLYVHGSE